MYLEGRKRVRFLLSAKQFGADQSFLISTSEDFPVLDTVPRSGYLARLEKQRDESFLLCLNQCHLCDVHLGYFSCGRGPCEREVIARIAHYFRTFRPINLEYRCVNVHIPAISKSGKRKIWCPRSFRRSYPKLGYDVDVNTAITIHKESAIRFDNAKPEWNAQAKSLVVKFQGNRILIPSVRNFLLCTSWDTSIHTGQYHDEDEISGNTTQASLTEDDAVSVGSGNTVKSSNTIKSNGGSQAPSAVNTPSAPGNLQRSSSFQLGASIGVHPGNSAAPNSSNGNSNSFYSIQSIPGLRSRSESAIDTAPSTNGNASGNTATATVTTPMASSPMVKQLKSVSSAQNLSPKTLAKRKGLIRQDSRILGKFKVSLFLLMNF
jgi:hypothetical protein